MKYEVEADQPKKVVWPVQYVHAQCKVYSRSCVGCFEGVLGISWPYGHITVFDYGCFVDDLWMLCGCFLFVACGGCGLVDIKIVVGIRKNLRMRKKTTLVWLISR